MSKTETPKSERSEPDPSMFGLPFTPDAFASYAREHLARLEAWMKELSTMEDAMIARARSTAQQLAQLTQDSLEYVAQLSAEWRKLAIDVARRASDIAVPKA
jgi:hypothetical protein